MSGILDPGLAYPGPAYPGPTSLERGEGHWNQDNLPVLHDTSVHRFHELAQISHAVECEEGDIFKDTQE